MSEFLIPHCFVCFQLSFLRKKLFNNLLVFLRYRLVRINKREDFCASMFRPKYRGAGSRRGCHEEFALTKRSSAHEKLLFERTIAHTDAASTSLSTSICCFKFCSSQTYFKRFLSDLTKNFTV